MALSGKDERDIVLKHFGQVADSYSIADDYSASPFPLPAVSLPIGFTQEKTALWRELCGAVSSKLSDAYLRAIFSFLTADDDEDRDIIVRDRRGMKLADRVALACVFVPDARLHDFIGE